MNLNSILLAGALVCGLPNLAFADAAPTTEVNFGAASSYQFRGVSQNISDDIQVFAGIDISAGNFYVGGWASNVDFGTAANLEIDAYAGFKPKLGPIEFDLGVLAYLYPQEKDLRTFEVKAAGSISNAADMSLTGAVFYSPELGKDGPSYWYGEISASAPIPGAKLGPFAFSVNGAIGTTNYENNPLSDDYSNWKLGVTAETENGWAVDVFYTDTDVRFDPLFKEKVVLQLKRSF